MKKSVKIIAVLIGICALLTAVSYAAVTQPVGPQQIVWQGSSRFNETNWPPISIDAMAGNLTQLTITALSQTRTWQGYYGDITATITLDDAANWTMYDWYDAEPQGEIYATTASVPDWSTVHCFNYTALNNTNTTGDPCVPGDPDCLYHTFHYDVDKSTPTTVWWNLTDIEASLGLARTDRDGVDETFNATGQILTRRLQDGSTTFVDHLGFFVGTVNISTGSCAATDMYETHCVNISEGLTREEQLMVNYSCCTTANCVGNYTLRATEDGANFQEVLLAVNDSTVLIYATIIENDLTDNATDNLGYNNRTWDFQMIVGEDGHDDAADSSTPYYFYIELE